MQHAAEPCNMQRTTCNRQQATRNRQHATNNMQHATRNRQHVTDMQPTTCNRRAIPCRVLGGQPTFTDRSSTVPFTRTSTHRPMQMASDITPRATPKATTPPHPLSAIAAAGSVRGSRLGAGVGAAVGLRLGDGEGCSVGDSDSTGFGGSGMEAPFDARSHALPQQRMQTNTQTSSDRLAKRAMLFLSAQMQSGGRRRTSTRQTARRSTRW
jgi:hypothetical protein